MRLLSEASATPNQGASPEDVARALLWRWVEPADPRDDDADGPPVGEENIVGSSDVGLVFAYRDAQADVEVELILVLHMPAGRPESGVDPVAGDFFRGLVDALRHAIIHASTLPRRGKPGPALAMGADFPNHRAHFILYSLNPDYQEFPSKPLLLRKKHSQCHTRRKSPHTHKNTFRYKVILRQNTHSCVGVPCIHRTNARALCLKSQHYCLHRTPLHLRSIS